MTGNDHPALRVVLTAGGVVGLITGLGTIVGWIATDLEVALDVGLPISGIVGLVAVPTALLVRGQSKRLGLLVASYGLVATGLLAWVWGDLLYVLRLWGLYFLWSAPVFVVVQVVRYLGRRPDPTRGAYGTPRARTGGREALPRLC